jgi:hypothetical protein
MTISQMHLSFDRVADIVATLGYPGLEAEEKDFFINRSIERFCKTRYSGNNVKGEGFGQSQKRIEDLRTILRRNPVSNNVLLQLSTTEWLYTLPTGVGVGVDHKYWLMVSANVVIDKDECGVAHAGRTIKAKQITHDQKEEYLDDPFHKPDYNEALILFEGNFVYIYTNGDYDVLEFNMTYLTYPAVVSLSTPTNCDLPDHTHQEIVDDAVRLYVGNVGDVTRTQIENNQITTTE